MQSLQDKITSMILRKAESHHCGDENVIYIDSFEEAEVISKEIIKIINEHINE